MISHKLMIGAMLLIFSINTSSTYALDININVTSMRHIKKTKRQKLPNDISFVIADLKYDGNMVKILEFGKGPHSGFQGHAKLYGMGKIWSKIWHYLGQFNKPIFYVGRPIKSSFRKREISYPYFKRNCFSAKDFDTLKKNKLFHKLCSTQSASHNNSVGTIVIRYYQGPKEDILDFQKQYPQFLFLNHAVAPFVNDKHKTAKLFQGTELNNFRPAWKVYERNTPNLVEIIKQDFPTQEILVIKPFRAAHGNGINIVSKNDLEQVLQELFPKRTVADDFWLTHNSSQFLVEECVSSKLLRIGHKKYDPTMRVAFILEHDSNAVNLTFLGCYWKLPKKASNEKGSLNECFISNISPDRACSAKVSKNDYNHVKALLTKALPKIYIKMIEETKQNEEA